MTYEEELNAIDNAIKNMSCHCKDEEYVKECEAERQCIGCNYFYEDKKSNIFANELEYIKSIELREMIREFLDEKVPDYFFEVSASSSGKYHPSFAAGEGGLVRHTKMVVAVLRELARFENCESEYTDYMIAACIIHDTFKHGNMDCGCTITSHPVIAAEEWKRFVTAKTPHKTRNEMIYNCIAAHMSQWSPECVKVTQDHFYCYLVQLADYIASRKFFDMFKEDQE